MKARGGGGLRSKAQVDRIVLTSTIELVAALPALSDFATVSDHGLLNVNEGFFRAPYGRSRQMLCKETRTRLFISYRPRFRKLPALRVAVVPDDLQGLQRLELEKILGTFTPYKLKILEFAIDFPWGEN